jgi:hypothetical protein
MGSADGSRFSIIERLTTQKVRLMEQKDSLSSEKTKKEQKVLELKHSLENCLRTKEKEIEEQLAEIEKEHKRNVDFFKSQIEKAEFEAKMAGENVEEKAKSYELRIKEIDKALEQIKEISQNNS